MLTIQAAVHRFWLALISLTAVTWVRSKLLHRASAAERVASQPTMTIKEQVTEMLSEPDHGDDAFAAWESERNEKLHEARQCEQEGLRLLNRATLLRVAIQCDDCGDTFHADELRERANGLNGHDFALEDSTPTDLRLFDSGETLVKQGA